MSSVQGSSVVSQVHTRIACEAEVVGCYHQVGRRGYLRVNERTYGVWARERVKFSVWRGRWCSRRGLVGDGIGSVGFRRQWGATGRAYVTPNGVSTAGTCIAPGSVGSL